MTGMLRSMIIMSKNWFMAFWYPCRPFVAQNTLLFGKPNLVRNMVSKAIRVMTSSFTSKTLIS